MRKSIHSESEMVKAVKELESGVSAEVVAREYGISKATLYQWKSKYSGMDVIQDGKTLTVGYGIDRQRVVQTLVDGNTRCTKRYFTLLYETVTEIHAFGATRRTSAMKTDND
jgi:hypothetical protein